MFGLFKKKSQLEKLQEQYKKLMKECHVLSASNRSASDAKFAEAEAIQDKIALLLKDKHETN
ncbi:Lacal_2735 family protein [Cellulophaga omnivescoria]|uniref:Lacal_2735 family protein n=1 Tax=Cellulophaga omnivescoria TaxID=1888890 RepID=UPI00098733AC|nr:Lacal_2735 family protein [Cellulophaga omnivescoria]WBU89316.1 Lacal_2735 family protein [Cellulophaga omnivescoria]WKB81322.1 Lacal_2735 family protein [Cellulophaga lytica]